MNTRYRQRPAALFLTLLLLGTVASLAAPLGTTFNYDGSLADGGAAANGSYDLQFTLYDASSGGSAVGGPLTQAAVAVSDGLFSTTLDFGSGSFNGQARWLEIAVRTNGAGSFATLTPRQPILAMPYALHALTVGSVQASNLVGSISSAQVGGVYSNGVAFVSGTNLFMGTFIGNLDGSNISASGEISAIGGISANGGIHANGDVTADGGITAQSNIFAQGSISVQGSISGFGDVSGSNIWATGMIQANGELHGTAARVGFVDCSGDTYVGGGLNVVGYSVLNGGFISKANSVVLGSFDVSGTKNFVQLHPTDPKKEIVYTCLEGPEAGTYVRGSAEVVNGQAAITLPESFGLVTSADGLTVQLTARGAWLQLYVTAATVERVTVREAEGRSGHFDYLVHGVRKGFENHQTIRERRSTGDGK